MDGNRRFAREIGLGNVLDGHTKGRDKLEEVLEWCLDVGVRILTVYAFSTENIRRESEEVQHLMHLFAENFRKVGDDERVHRHKIRVTVFGNRELLPAEVIDAIEYAEARTKDYDQYRFNVAVAYGGREEILLAIRNVVRDAQAGKVDPADVDEKFFSKRLYTADLPDPDLVLRTSGEERISNFLLWQLAYAELYFVDVYWPGFRKIDFLRALRSYQMRQRRYGEWRRGGVPPATRRVPSLVSSSSGLASSPTEMRRPHRQSRAQVTWIAPRTGRKIQVPPAAWMELAKSKSSVTLTAPLPGMVNGRTVLRTPSGTIRVMGVPSARTPSTASTTSRSCVYLPAAARSKARSFVRFPSATKSIVGEESGREVQPLALPAAARWTWMSENVTVRCFQSAGASRT